MGESMTHGAFGKLQPMSRAAVSIIAALMATRLVDAQVDSHTWIPACITSSVDTTGWVEYQSSIAPVVFLAPANFLKSEGGPSSGIDRGASGEEQPGMLGLRNATEVWSGPSAPRVITLLRIHAHVAPNTERESPTPKATFCRDRIAGVNAIIESRRVEAPARRGNRAPFYFIRATLALDLDDSLVVTGLPVRSLEEQSVLRAILHSLRLYIAPEPDH